MIRSFSLHIRYLEHGIAYLRHGSVIVDVAMPIQEVVTATIAGLERNELLGKTMTTH